MKLIEINKLDELTIVQLKEVTKVLNYLYRNFNHEFNLYSVGANITVVFETNFQSYPRHTWVEHVNALIKETNNYTIEEEVQ